MALIANAALAVSQYSYAAARYTAVHGAGNSASSYGSTLKSNVGPPPTICTSGFAGCGSGAGLSSPSVTCTSGCTGGNLASGAQFSVTVTYNLSTGGKIDLPNPFFGFTFPTTLSSSTAMMAE